MPINLGHEFQLGRVGRTLNLEVVVEDRTFPSTICIVVLVLAFIEGVWVFCDQSELIRSGEVGGNLRL